MGKGVQAKEEITKHAQFFLKGGRIDEQKQQRKTQGSKSRTGK